MIVEYYQNNSGGEFHVHEDVTLTMLIVADSVDEANVFAERHTGIYFQGCSLGIDCGCCGDRWDIAREPWDVVDDLEESLKVYAQRGKDWLKKSYYDKVPHTILFDTKTMMVTRYYVSGKKNVECY